MNCNELPKTLQEAIRHFSDDLLCINFVASLRWENGVATCPKCGNDQTSFLSTRKIWKCKGCKKQFSVKVGTIFEDSPIGLDKWLTAIWMIANCKNGISSYEIHRAIGITQKSAWFVLHRIRIAMDAGTFEKLSGEVEADEAYIGGSLGNMHIRKRNAAGFGKNARKHQTVVLGMVERKGRARARAISSAQKKEVVPILRENVEQGSLLYTDENRIYDNLANTFEREVINHSIQYVRDNVHTNSVENFWSCLKRTIKGTYISVSPEHLQKYIEEQTFRFNERKGKDQDRFLKMIESISGKRLTYKELIGYEI